MYLKQRLSLLNPQLLILYLTSCTLRALLRLQFNLNETRYFIVIVFIEELLNVQFLFVFPSGVYTNKSEGFPLREQVTYSCPCEKHGFSKFSPHTCTDCPCALLMVIAKASRTGNCIGMRGNSTSSLLKFHLKL
jgi:hypothetical protein